jgi:hypothetical protein
MDRGVVCYCNFVAEDITLQKITHYDSLFKQLDENLVEKKEEGVGVLVFDDVGDHLVQSSHLVLLVCDVQSRDNSFLSFVQVTHLIENWILPVELCVLKTHKSEDNSAVKR